MLRYDNLGRTGRYYKTERASNLTLSQSFVEFGDSFNRERKLDTFLFQRHFSSIGLSKGTKNFGSTLFLSIYSFYSTLYDTGSDPMKSKGLRGNELTWDNLGHVIPTSNDVTSRDASSDVLTSDVLTSDVLTSDVLTSQVPVSSITPEEIRMIKRHVQQWKTIKEISCAIGRPKEQTRRRIISKLLKQGYVEMEYPETPNHPHQRYRIKK